MSLRSFIQVIYGYSFCCSILLQEVLDSIGISIWQIAAEPHNNLQPSTKQETKSYENGHDNSSITSGVDEEDNSESEDEDADKVAIQINEDNDAGSTRLAIACDDGCVRIYMATGAEKLVYNRTLPRVSGETSTLYSQVTFFTFLVEVYNNGFIVFIFLRANTQRNLEFRCK